MSEPHRLEVVTTSPEVVERFRQEVRAALWREERWSVALRRRLEARAQALGVHLLDRERVSSRAA